MRKQIRESAWRKPGWDECVAYTGKFVNLLTVVRPRNGFWLSSTAHPLLWMLEKNFTVQKIEKNTHANFQNNWNIYINRDEGELGGDTFQCIQRCPSPFH